LQITDEKNDRVEVLKDSPMIYPPNYSQATLHSSDKGTLKFIDTSCCAVEHGRSTWRVLFLVFKYVSEYRSSNFSMIVIFGVFQLPRVTGEYQSSLEKKNRQMSSHLGFKKGLKIQI